MSQYWISGKYNKNPEQESISVLVGRAASGAEMTEATNLDAAGSAILPETGDAQERPDARGPGNKG